MLCCGDNLELLRTYIHDSQVDLIYLDPPFNSSRDYKAFFDSNDASDSNRSVTVFEDKWKWNETMALAFRDVVENSKDRISSTMQAFRCFPGNSGMLAYLSMMAPRLVELRRVLKSTGSIYLHCDPTASHYLKILMDSIFTAKNFRNEIIWHYRTGNVAKKQFQRKHDVILFYSKTSDCRFRPLEIKEYYSQIYGPRFKPTFKGRKHGEDEYGAYRMTFIDDVWDISAVFTLSSEHVDYPTQKPLALLERIIKAGSDTGDIVLDPFCGSGTTIVASERLERGWIGMDINPLAISVVERRLQSEFGNSIRYKKS